MTLTFNNLREANLKRNAEVFEPCESWEPNDWATAVAGEVGELCNLLKKRKRGEVVSQRSLANEAADVVCYLDLLCARLDIDLANAIVLKFDEVSARKGARMLHEYTEVK